MITTITITDELALEVSIALPLETGMQRDQHLEHCDLARKGGPDAALACVECGRAKWMHGTRHDTCGQFCYVHEATITAWQIMTLRHVPSLPHELKIECSRALNEFGLAPGRVRDAKRAIAAFINTAKCQAAGR